MKALIKNNLNYILSQSLELIDTYIYMIVLKNEYKKTVENKDCKMSPKNLDYLNF